MNVLRSVWIKFVAALTFIFGVIWVVNLIDTEVFSPESQTDLSATLIFSVLGVVLLLLIFRNLLPSATKVGKFLYRSRWIVFGVIIVLELITVTFGSSTYGADAGIILNIAQGKSGYLTNDYFLYYPNNLVVLFVYRAFYLLFGSTNMILALNYFNVLIVAATFLYMARVMNRVLDKRGYVIAFYLFLFSTTFTPYVLTPYSDTLVLIFVVAMLDFGTRVWEATTIKSAVVNSLGLALAAGIGSLIKPSAVMPFIAIFIVLILFQVNRKNLLLVLVILGISVGGFAGVKFIDNEIQQHQTLVKTSSNQAFPFTHFIMMGVNYYGGYTPEDFQITRNAKGKSKREKLNIEIIKMRLKQRGVQGYLKFLLLKERNNTSSGTYTMNTELWLTNEHAGPKNNSVTSFIERYFYPNGKQTIVYKLWAQMIFVLVAIGVALSGWYNGVKQEKIINWLQLAALGGILFLLIFEGGRSRYLMQFMPTMTLIAASGFESLLEKKEAR